MTRRRTTQIRGAQPRGGRSHGGQARGAQPRDAQSRNAQPRGFRSRGGPTPGTTPWAREPRLSLREPVDVLAAIPYLIGFHPTDSVIVLGLRGKSLVFTARYDLPPMDASGREVNEMIDHMLEVVLRQDLTGVLVVGFGPDHRVRPVVSRLEVRYARAGLAVHEVLRALDGRYWSYLCSNESCCPPEGSPYDAETSPTAAAWTVAGRVVLPDREAYEQQLEPVEGPRRIAVRLATARAHDRLMALVKGPANESGARAALASAGKKAVREALDRQRAGECLDDEEVAWLSVLLTSMPIRDMAWSTIRGTIEELETHQTLWKDMTRRVEPDLIAAPGSLFAFAAWRSGEGALARVALERVLAENPDYSMARLLEHILAQGISPSAFDDLPAAGFSGQSARRRRRRSSSRRAGSRSA